MPGDRGRPRAAPREKTREMVGAVSHHARKQKGGSSRASESASMSEGPAGPGARDRGAFAQSLYGHSPPLQAYRGT